MANIIEQQQDLEYFPDEQLISEASQPSGRFPGYLLIAEVERRQQYRDRYNASQQAQEGEQPSIMEQAVEEYSAGIPSADPNFQGQQPGPQMAGGGKVPRYAQGREASLFINPRTNKPYTSKDIGLMQKEIAGMPRRRARYGALLETRPEELSRQQIEQVIKQYRQSQGVWPAMKSWGQQLLTPDKPLAAPGDVAARQDVLRGEFSDLSGVGLPNLLRDPNLYNVYKSLGEDSAAFMEWVVNDSSELAQQARTHIEAQSGKKAAELGKPSGLLSIDPASAVAERGRQELAGKEVKGADGQTTPDATGIESLTDYGDRLARSVTGDDEGLGSLLKRGQPSTELTPEEKQAYAASMEATEARVGIAELPAGVHSKEWSDEQTRLLAREAFDDTEFADYLEGVPGTIEEMRNGLEARIKSQIETRGERDVDMKKALKDALISGDEVDRRSTSMLLGTLGRAVMKIGIDSVGASEILAEGASDIWDYKRSTKIENLDIQKSLNEIARKADSDELRLHEAMVNNNTAEISGIIEANQALITGQQADDAIRNSITTGIEEAHMADQNAIRGREVDIAEAKAAVAQLLVAKATLSRSLIDKGQEYYAKTFTAIVNAWSAMYSSVSAQNSQEANRLNQIKLAIDILETELTNMTPGQERQQEIQRQMQSLISQLGLDLAAPGGTGQSLTEGAQIR